MLYMFRAVSPPVIRSSKNVHTASILCRAATATATCYRYLLPLAWVSFQLAHASGSSKQSRHTPDAVCTVFELLMMGGETA